MLTINLLTPARHRRRRKSLVLITGALAVSIMLVAGLTAWSYALITHVNELRGDLITATQRVAQLRLTARHIQELDRDAERLRMRRALLEQVLASPTPASQILETIRSVIPRGVWLTSVTAGTSDVAVEGYTFSYPSVARFMLELEDSGTVRHVDLSMSQSEPAVDRELVKFRITGELVVTRPVASQNEAAP